MVKSPTQQLRPLILSEHWKLFEDYLAGEKSRLVSQLCNCNESDLKDIQGQIRTLDTLMKMRDKLRTELGSNS